MSTKSKVSPKPSKVSWQSWPPHAKLRLYGALRAEAWQRIARADQRAPEGDWRSWYVRGGRGSGKTRTGAETLANWILTNPAGDWAIVAPTYADARNVCVEGKHSGLLKALGPAVQNWNRSLGEIQVANGARVVIDGGDDGALRIQGENLCGAWCDEVGLWRNWETAWHESLAFAVRIDPARIIATGTPKGRHGIPKLLLEDEGVPVSRLRTADNAANLSPAQLAELEQRYAGTRLGRQELEGELLDDVEGALWTWEMLEENRVSEAPELKRIVVAIDPEASNNPDSSETGIIVAGLGLDGHGYVLHDRSLKASPHGWAGRAVSAYHDEGADRIVAERNNGGDMVEATIRTVDPKVPVRTVWASRGKLTRAEPVAALYEQGRVHHVGSHSELESQLTGWVPEDTNSPDRLDALVWAMWDLLLRRRAAPDVDAISVTGQSHWR